MIFITIILGLIAGSFLSAVIYRLHSGESITLARSHCASCKHSLGVLDLVPLFSFLFLAGRCRYCGKKISKLYPLLELSTALVFLLFAFKFNFNPGPELIFSVIFAGVLMVVAVFDFKHYLILDRVVIPSFIAVMIYNVIHGMRYSELFLLDGRFISGIIGALVISGFFFLQYYFSKGKWIGFGDIKFGLLLGAIVGWPLSLILLFMSYICGSVVGLSLMAWGKKQFGSRLPFGTFLAFSGIITMLYGEEILRWYLNLLGL